MRTEYLIIVLLLIACLGIGRRAMPTRRKRKK